ncbi:MAG: DUF2851 family protein [Balneolaceae bacterium]
MRDAEFPYSEDVLHWIWQEMLFSREGLKTTCGKNIQIIHPGSINTSDGPDFFNAKLKIGDLTWMGAVELHVKTASWQQHKHHTDPNYNNVVLHVVADNSHKAVSCANQTQPFTLNLLPYLTKEMASFIASYDQGDILPCAANVHFISEEAFNSQIEKAHTEYLEQKVHDFFSFFSAEELQSIAWKNALFIALFDGFGISHNRAPMQQLAQQLLSSEALPNEDFTQLALETAFNPANNYQWKYKASRPAGQPKQRIKQAANFGRLVLGTPFSEFLKSDALKLWETWCSTLKYSNTGRIQILYGTVFIPALYAAASMFAYKKLQNACLKEWCSLQSPIPNNLLKPFHSLPLPPQLYNKKLGAIHQLRSYCVPKQCSKCFVLKKAFHP